MSVDAVRVILSAASQDEMNAMYRAFLGDQGRAHVRAMHTTREALIAGLRDVGGEVAVVDVELLTGEGERGIAEFFKAQMNGAVAVALVPTGLSHLAPVLRELDRVREVLVKPVNHGELIRRVHQIGLSERAARSAASPAGEYVASHAPAARGVAVAGTRVFAFAASKGGVGKTTLAVNFAYRLQQAGIRTCLLGFDVPDDAGVFLGLYRAPNSLHFYRRPGREGFAASIQTKDGLDVVLSPNDHVEAARIAARRPEEAGAIARLVEAARNHHPPYAAIVMDLPPTESEWSVQPLTRANTVLMVLEPSVADEIKLIDTLRLLTGVMRPEYQVPREAIFAVLNKVMRRADNLTPGAIQDVVRHELDGFAPPVIGQIEHSDAIRALQNRALLPVTRDEAFREGVDRLVEYFYRDVLGRSPARAAREKGGLWNRLVSVRVVD